MRTIMIPVADRPECATALSVSFDLAEQLSADVLGYHLRPHDHEGKRNPKSPHQIALNSKAAGAMFTRVAEHHGLPVRKQRRLHTGQCQAIWREAKGTPNRVFPIIGPLSDLIVVSRPSGKSAKTARAFQLAALLHGCTPVLILPSRKPKQMGKSIVIAWNQSAEASLAVKAAIPLLKVADHVHIVAAGKEDGVGPKSRHVQQYLKHWGIEAGLTNTVGRSSEDELMAVYDELGADLLVMGAYSRPRWRETVFGGFTEFMLNKAKIPAFMLHR